MIWNNLTLPDKPYYQDDAVIIYNADCREVLPLIPDKSIDLVLTDPPYNIGHDDWDRILDYKDWLVSIFRDCSLKLKENGTLWYFHMEFKAICEIGMLLESRTGLKHRQFITLDKGIQSIAGRTSDKLRTFPRATEYLQFYTFEDVTGTEQLSDQYQAVNPMERYLTDEIKRAGVTNKEITQLFPSKTGGMTGCLFNWLSGLNFPTIEQYQTIREYINRNGNEYLRREYEDLRREYEDLRYTFNLPQGVTDVWKIDCYKDNGNKHSSSKPQSPVQRVIETCTKTNDLILDPFLGSGTTAYCAKKLGRKCIGIEISERYAEIAAKRCSQAVMNLETESPKEVKQETLL
jgi:site-specific DNA-methyltransferase (adenine-specific)